MKFLIKHLALFTMGGGIYYTIELFYRGYSHWTMSILGGICFIFLGLINEYLSWDTPLWKQAILGTAIITALEFITGCIVNIWLNWNVWDYSSLPFNLYGQISLLFSLIWIPLSLVGIILDDYLRYYLFKEEKPRYKLY